MHSYKTQINLHDTDAAGLLFFSNQFKLIHDAYEALLEKIGFGFGDLIKNQPFFLPIVHAESDYKAPLFVGDWINIDVDVESVGTTSFTFVYRITKTDGTLVGTARTVHVTIDKETKNKIPLPPKMKEQISALLPPRP
ncbi:MAG: acyl-CoA thioesterase [Candidatus Omnitrophica bacterium]|nr:acyl-CoA thioesterase [Candidatus Omnitrophota bacterium]